MTTLKYFMWGCRRGDAECLDGTLRVSWPAAGQRTTAVRGTSRVGVTQHEVQASCATSGRLWPPLGT